VIVLSLAERDPEFVRSILVSPPAGADAVEVRLDALKRCEPAAWFPGGAGAARPVIAACRRREEGGAFRGGERRRRETLLAAARAGVAYVDVEFGSPLVEILDDVAPAKGILSHHDLRRTPPAATLFSLYRRMSRVPGAAAVKIVTTARDPADILEIRRLLARAAGREPPLAAFAMGEPGVASRILAPAWGSWATYAALRRGAESAPGQITLAEATGVYRVSEIGEETRLTGITGHPIAHSLSPVMHNAAFFHNGIDFRYVPFPASKIDRLSALVRALRIRGLSVTAPHKAALGRRLRRVEPLAREVGAVNTLVFGGGELVGFNTDVEGTLGPLRRRIDPAGKVAALVGAGGAARAAAVGLARAGAGVLVASRRERPGREVARLAGGRWTPIRRLARESYDILINATPAGMDGRSLPVPAPAVKGSLVADLVYAPVVTPLLRLAMERGIPTLGGLEVLLAQGAAQYALFTGREAPVEAMREALMRAVAAPGGVS
jgi:3-dehydroquinate dehydratase/shikimate dehydrogenase